MGGFTPRFAFEVAFLAILAVAAGLADARWWVIAAIMGAAWLLILLVEWFAWRAEHAERELELRWHGAPAGPQPHEQTVWDMKEILAPGVVDGTSSGAQTRIVSIVPDPVDEPWPGAAASDETRVVDVEAAGPAGPVQAADTTVLPPEPPRDET